MPAVHFTIRWPDGTEERCYSPSTVLIHYFGVGETYSVEDFIRQAEKALVAASNRVEERFGYACSSAADQLKALQARASSLDPSGQVEILAIQ